VLFPLLYGKCQGKTRKDGLWPTLFIILCCSMYFCVVLCIICFVPFSVLFVYTCVLNYCHRVATQLHLNVYHIVYHIYHVVYHTKSYHISSYHITYYITSYIISYIISYTVLQLFFNYNYYTTCNVISHVQCFVLYYCYCV
jgi:hypothetical protein